MLNDHSGELVEVSALPGKWKLRKVRYGHRGWETLPWQFVLNENGKTLQELNTKPSPISSQHALFMDLEIKKVALQELLDKILSLRPDWYAQRYRITCPCSDNRDYIWVRAGNVISLGELDRGLSDLFDCAAIY